MSEKGKQSSLGDRVRNLRQLKGWSLTELSERAGISRSYLFQIEQGNSSPTQAKMRAIADALDVSVSSLLGEEITYPVVSGSLKDFVEQEGLDSTDAHMLADIQYRGKKPSTVKEWKAIYSIIKGMLEE